MRKLMKKGMLILGTMILVLHAFLLPVGIVYAETTDKKEGGQVQEEEQLELPSIKNYLEVEKEGNPRFSFPRSRLQGTVEEPLKVTFVSDQEVSEAKITLPKEAKLVKDQLQAGVTINQEEESDEWTIQAERAQQTFVLPVVYESEGNYEVSVEEATATLEISEKEETEIEDQSEMNQKSSDESNEEHEQDVNATEQSEEKEAPVATEESKEEAIPSENETFEQAVFEGNTAEVATMAAFREAVADPEVSIISVQDNLSENIVNIMSVSRPLLIQGNGYTLTFGNNGFYFQLEDVDEATTFRIENATITKVGATPLVNASVEVSHNWVLEIEDVAEVNANAMQLASIPEGMVQFTGGASNFTRTTSTQTFIQAKEVKAVNEAQVTISRGNATIFLAAATVSEPKLTIEDGATLAITTTSGVANTIDFRGENAEVALQSGGGLTISTIGTTAAPTNTSNNTIALTGAGPKITVRDKSNFTTTSTAAKRGLHLSGNNPQVIVDDSELSVTSATQSAVNLSGNNPQMMVDSSELLVTSTTTQATVNLAGSEPSFSVTNSRSDIRSTTGPTLALTGISPKVSYVETTGSLTSTTGQRLNLIGDNPQLSLDQTQLSMSATTGRGIYLEGTTPQVLLNESNIEIIDTDVSQGMILVGADALLSLEDNSNLIVNGAGTGTLENIQIGSNNPRPELSLIGASKVTVTTTSGTGGASDTANNALHLRGEQPKMTISEESELNISVTSNARRGVFLNGAEADLTIKDSQLNINTATGQGLTINGRESSLQAINTDMLIRSTSGQRLNLVGALPKLVLDNSHVTMGTTTGRGIFLQGATPQVLLNESQIEMTDTGDSQGMILEGTDALLSLKKNSAFNISGGGTGTTENIQVGNNNARPKIDLEGGSKLGVTTTSGTGAGSATINNALHLRGSDPELNIADRSNISINITSGNRRGIVMTGNNSTTHVDSSDIKLKLAGSGVGYSATGTTNKLAISKSQWEANGSSGHNIHMDGDNSTVLLDHSDTVFETASSGKNIWLAGADSALVIENGAQVNATSDNANSITIHGARASLQMSGSTSKMEVISNVSAAETNAAVYLGAAMASTTSGANNPNAEIRLTEGAKLNIHANHATALGLLSKDGKFDLLSNSELNLTAGSTDETKNGAVSVLRFIRAGGYQFTIDNAKMNISKTGGRTPGIRMYGGNNHILVRNGGQFFIYNPGDGVPRDQDTASGLANQGVHYPRTGDNSFVVDGLGSKVQIVADNGAAIDMESQAGQIEARDGATFIAQGRTATDAGGIFNAGNATVRFENPLFMDFRNTRIGGGNIFNVSSGATLNAINSDLSVWRKGADLSGDPDLDIRTIDYSFTGTNFNTLSQTSAPDQLNTEVFGNTGLTAYSRLSSNNGRWAIADELRVPTNADKKIYGRVSLPVGLDDSRPAWDDEAIVTVEVKSPSGHTRDYTTKTVGHSDESPGISIYGEAQRGGLFEITLPAPLEAGSKVRISHVELTSGELTEGFDHQILTDTVEVFPIVPPVPAKFSSSIIGENSRTIQGTSENKEVEVTATHNGQSFDTSEVTVNDDGRFTLDLSELVLKEDDEIQIFLRDNAGSAKAAEVVAPPETNNDRGNINPPIELLFHDVTFEPATILTVGNLGPVSPVDPMNPEIEVDPENKPELEEEQGLLSIDFASQFTFGEQAISTRTKRYYAQPQRLLNPDGTVNEVEERPNYIQISDRRPEEERHGWQLAVTQNSQFTDLQENELRGARLSLTNQQLKSVHGSDEPTLYAQDGVTLIPGEKTKLLTALDGQGAGTWIYRFGDGESASESVALEVPPTANPRASTYETTLTWELSAVPGN
ncbi:WxL domain-containing protein [Enterococcus sp. DIV0806c]|uniref:WxL domain-containing protein n=1 Tax=unclassified Enterococcus TaxID=2608891 RepID=UPI003F2670EE